MSERSAALRNDRKDGHVKLERQFLGQLAATACATKYAAAQPDDAPDVAEFRSLYSEATEQAVRAGLDYLADNQNDDGSIGAGVYNRNAAVCGLCGMSILASGSTPGRGPYGAMLTGIVAFLLSACQESGFITFAESASRGPMYGHGFATLFLAEAYGMSPRVDLRTKLAKAVELIINTQNNEGGWRYEPRRNEADLSVTVCQVMALRAARNAGIFVPNDTVDRATAYVKQCQSDDGGFIYMAGKGGSSEFPRSAAAVVALYSAGIYEGQEIERGLDYLLRHPPRGSALGGQGYFLYGHYYAIQAMWHAGGPRFTAWYKVIRDVLLPQQRDDGSWADLYGPQYATAMSCLILQMPSNYLPIFRR